MRSVTIVFCAILILCSFSQAQATTIHVPGDSSTIQGGINGAVNGDTVLVADETYTGLGNRDIDFGGKGVVLKSENGPDVTIIDCQGSSSDPHRAFHFHSGEDSTTVVDGFTIQGGYGPFDDPVGHSVGGGIKCDSSSSPKIINNIIIGNSAREGGGIYCYESNPSINNNTISENSADSRGGGIYCYLSNPSINNNTISGNSAVVTGGGIECQLYSNPTISNNTISGNSTTASGGGGINCFIDSSPTISTNTISGNSAYFGGGIACVSSSNPTIINNTIRENSADVSGGGISCGYRSNPTISNNTVSGNSADEGGGIYCRNDSDPTLENCIIAFSAQGEAVFCFDGTSNPTLTCCDVYGNGGGDWVDCIADQADTNGNFSLDPLFCDMATGDFQLDVFSPCRASSPFNTCGVLIGALDVGCDLGFMSGDANGDGEVNIGDVVYLVSYLYKAGPAPVPTPVGDVNCDGLINVGDIVYLVNYLFRGGPPPCEP
ncbi:MAG: right-handed parallel beta-helix repeat-containing protein [Candidatus Zixiibacteriota bacterium]